MSKITSLYRNATSATNVRSDTRNCGSGNGPKVATYCGSSQWSSPCERNNEGLEFDEQCVEKVKHNGKDMQEELRTDIVVSPGSEKKLCGTHTEKPNGEWDHGAEDMTINPSESEHPVFRGTSTFERGFTQSKGVGQLSAHFCGENRYNRSGFSHDYFPQSAQCLRSSKDMCDELASRISDCSESTGKLEVEDKSDHGSVNRFVDNNHTISDQ